MKLMKIKLKCLANLRKIKLMFHHNKSEFIVLGIMFLFCLLFFKDSESNFGIDLNNLIPILVLILSLLNLMNGNPLLKVQYQDLVNKCISFRTFKYKTVLQLVLGRVISYFLIIYLFELSADTKSQLVVSLLISYSVYIFSVLQYNIKGPTLLKGGIIVLSLVAFLMDSVVLTILLCSGLTLIWLLLKRYSYVELFDYYISYESLRQGILVRDNSTIQSAQSEMFDKKSKTKFSILNKEYASLNSFYLKYELTNLIRRGKSLITLYLTMILLYLIKTALGFSEDFNIVLMLFTIGSMQVYIFNQKSSEDRALQSGYYFRYPIKILLKTKYLAVFLALMIPFIFYVAIFKFSLIIFIVFFYVPLQISCGYIFRNKFAKLLLNLPTLLLISLMMF